MSNTSGYIFSNPATLHQIEPTAERNIDTFYTNRLHPQHAHLSGLIKRRFREFQSCGRHCGSGRFEQRQGPNNQCIEGLQRETPETWPMHSHETILSPGSLDDGRNQTLDGDDGHLGLWDFISISHVNSFRRPTKGNRPKKCNTRPRQL